MRKRIVIISSAVIVCTVGGFIAGTFDTKHSMQPTLVHQPIKKQYPQAFSLDKKIRNLSVKDGKKYEAVPIINENGKKIKLNIKQTPMVFIADWDTSILDQFKGQVYKKPPTFVCTLLNQEKYTDEIRRIQQALKEKHIVGNIVALDDPNPYKDWITGVPDTYVWKKDHVEEIPGPLLPREIHKWETIFQ